MLDTLVIENENKGVHTLAKHYVNGSPDALLPTKLNWVKENFSFFSKEQDADIFSDIPLPGRFPFDIFAKTNHLFLYFLLPQKIILW